METANTYQARAFTMLLLLVDIFFIKYIKYIRDLIWNELVFFSALTNNMLFLYVKKALLVEYKYLLTEVVLSRNILR